jgi:hypothetical protein
MKKSIPYRIYKAYYENLCYDGILRRGEYDAAAKAIAVEGDDCIMALLDAAMQQTDLYPTNRMAESIIYSLPTAEATLAAAAPTREELVAAILYDIDGDDPISSPARAYRRQAIAVRDMLPDSWRGRTLAELREQQEAASAQAEAEMREQEAQYDPLARCWRRYDPERDLWIECSEKEAAPAATGTADAR